jgi:bilin biosynthesis protein
MRGEASSGESLEAFDVITANPLSFMPRRGQSDGSLQLILLKARETVFRLRARRSMGGTVWFVIVCLLAALCPPAEAQPWIPREKIPADLVAPVREQVARLYSGDRETRAAAAFALGEMGATALPSLPFLAACYNDDVKFKWKSSPDGAERETSVYDEVARALRKMGAPAREYLVLAMRQDDYRTRVSAARFLGHLSDPLAVPPLIEALSHEDINLREEAIRALGKTGDPRAVRHVSPFLRDPNEFMREKAAVALSDIHDPQTVEPLISALGDPDRTVRRLAAEGLGFTKDQRAVDPLIAALGDKEYGVRVYAAKSLGEIGDRRAVKPLKRAMKDRNVEIRRAALVPSGRSAGRMSSTSWRTDSGKETPR